MVAAPPSTLYRVRKFVRRRKKAVAAVAAIVFLLVAGSIAAGVGLAALGVGLAIALSSPSESVALRVGPGGLAVTGRLP